MCVVTKLAAESSVQQVWCGRVSLLPSFGGTDAKVAAVTTLASPSPCLFVTRARLALAASYQLDLTMYMGKQIVIEISVFNGSLMPDRSDVQNVHDASRRRSSLVLAPAVRCCWCGETLSA